jgi:XTP/dITP diphosphohydrolase
MVAWYYFAGNRYLPMQKLLLATTNPGKLEELRALLADLPVELVAPPELSLHLDVQEKGRDYAENAALKARSFATASGLTALADDSGLEVDALNGAPGLHSARFSPLPGATDADRRAHLLLALAGKPQPWTARFRSALCLALPNGDAHFASGECHWQIRREERGQGGFGYDRLFVVEGLEQTMAELSMAKKNTLSHRAKAISEMKGILKTVVDGER